MSVKLPSFSSYGKYSSDNYGAHTLEFTDSKGNQFYYSYNTLVAFRASKDGKKFVRENTWGTTTGKHLNWIDGGNKKQRLPANEFEKEFKKYFGKI